MSNSIIVSNLGKKFKRHKTRSNWTLQQTIINGFKREAKSEFYWALKNVSFSIPKGKMLGIVGHNGAGKSTLLQLVGGIGKPDEGSIEINGRVGALLGLGAGFHPELTGRENINTNGVISGLTRRELKRQIESIIDFSEIRDFIDNPIHTYSSGMRMRLAFAIAIHIQPEVLLIDEVLGVGDAAFKKKCISKINAYKERGCTVMMVAHQTGFVRDNCDIALWLDSGQIIDMGEPKQVIGDYLSAMNEKAKLNHKLSDKSGTVSLRSVRGVIESGSNNK
ncbi:MAG: ABC transporter ATP-binding protein [Chloroflexota bacterium]